MLNNMNLLWATIISLLALGAASSHIQTHESASSVHEDSENSLQNSSLFSNIEPRASTPYWLEGIQHQGISAFGPGGYQVFRNVKDYGARGDGVTDDTAAINAAMNAGGRCGQGCPSSTVTPAIIYFPSGTYLLSSSIVDQYYTQIIGNPNNLPVLKAMPGFSGFGLIDGNKYYTENLNWGSTNVFWRQVRNLVFDLTSLPTSSSTCGIHWPTSQATSLQNLVFQMSSAPGTQHIGIFCESGSAGFINDLTFNGGNIALQVGNQQFTMRNIVFNNCVTAISQLWSWGWLYQGLQINNCQRGIDMSAGGRSDQKVGSMVMIDSTITNTPVGIITAFDSTSAPNTAGSLILENVAINNVGVAIQQTGGATLLAGSTAQSTIAAWGQGNQYTPSGPKRFQGLLTPAARPASLLTGNSYYTRSKPQYNDLPTSSFLSVRSMGARGDGATDDTAALQNTINTATSAGQVVFIDSGTYRTTSTLFIPPGAKIVGEAYPIIMSSGGFFNDMANPRPVIKVGNAGQIGQVEWTDTIVSTQGTQAGAIGIQWNLASSGTPSGLWDVHVRIGGFAGSNLQIQQCPKTPGASSVNTACIGAYMMMHVASSASNLYMENVWFWTADHDIDSSNNLQITVYTGRGLYIESTAGNLWLVGTSSEHNNLYQYQLASTRNIFMGFVQTETPYYQPNPIAPTPFSPVASINDPDFAATCAGKSGNCADAWGMRIVNSENVLVYGAGLYSFFNDYSTTCSNLGGPENCQANIFSLEGNLGNVQVYCLSTVGTTNMITQNGNTIASYSDNINVFTDTIALYTTGQSTCTNRWDYTGCYTDQVAARTLGTALNIPGGASAMTVEACLSICQAAGYSLAGVEYASECYCDNTLRNGGGPAPDGEKQCDMPCSGNKGETCGGGNRLSLYTYKACSSIPTAQWHSKGCYTDSIAARTLTVGPVGTGSAMTVESCQAACKGLGYIYAGVEYAVECWCDSALRNGGAPVGDGCNMPCSGNTAQTCGGGNRLNLYTFGP
ncbi:glycoside hydrolase family 55 protein [Tricladium varicosporioides]|nr:glycoside hydrolase family 55 protein [Hymenoscyphus varicosporioides]